MAWVVIPAHNEGSRLSQALDSAWGSGAEEVLVVDNGSEDDTRDCVARHEPPARVITIPFPLGPDIPRAVGASLALGNGATAVLFLDGDMTGPLGPHLGTLLARVASGVDLVLTDAFPYGPATRGMAGEVNRFRLCLNRVLGWEHLGASILSHGPAAVSRRCLQVVGCRALGHPPVAMARAAQHGLSATVGAPLSHDLMAGAGRDAQHAVLMAETIIGDCLEAVSLFRGQASRRSWRGHRYTGYDRLRRWAWLDAWLAATSPGPWSPCT